MNKTLILGLYLGCVAGCWAQRTVAEYDWKKLAAAGQGTGGVVTEVDGRAVLKVVNTNDTALRAQLLTIEAPRVSQKVYAITGEVRYEGVRGDGYLEMWNCFPPPKPGTMEARYFSRTLGESGPMGKISGTSSWRAFTLPFDRTGTEQPPKRLEINLFLPRQGTVYLGPLKLVEYAGGLGDVGKGKAGAWWSDRQAGLIGGIGGATIGCLASLLALLASRGVARGLVLGVWQGLIGLGVALAAVGVVALCTQQPYGVWMPLVLTGVLLLCILPMRLRQIQKFYEELELRRMASMDMVKG
jgi:hypothetical protein